MPRKLTDASCVWKVLGLCLGPVELWIPSSARDSSGWLFYLAVAFAKASIVLLRQSCPWWSLYRKCRINSICFCASSEYLLFRRTQQWVPYKVILVTPMHQDDLEPVVRFVWAHDQRRQNLTAVRASWVLYRILDTIVWKLPKVNQPISFLGLHGDLCCNQGERHHPLSSEWRID